MLNLLAEINMSNSSQLLQNAFDVFTVFIGRDILISLLVTVIVIAIYIGSDKNIRITLGILILIDFFLGVALQTIVIFAFCIVSGLIGAYGLYKSLYD